MTLDEMINEVFLDTEVDHIHFDAAHLVTVAYTDGSVGALRRCGDEWQFTVGHVASLAE